MPASDAEAPTRDKRRRINARPRKDAVADYLGVLVAALVLPGDAMACDAGGVAATQATNVACKPPPLWPRGARAWWQAWVRV